MMLMVNEKHKQMLLARRAKFELGPPFFFSISPGSRERSGLPCPA